MKNSKWLIMSSLLLLNLACQEKGGPQRQRRAPQLPVIPVTSQDVTTYKTYPTNVQGIVSSEMRAKVSGYIDEVLVNEGERVEKGQTLFRLETQALSSDAQAAQARMNSARIEVERLQPLVKKDIVSPVSLETAKANLAQAKSDLQSIKANIEYANMKSPVQGMVGDINYRNGALVSPADQVPLTTVADINQVFADFSINEKEYYNILAEKNIDGANLSESFQSVSLLLPNGKEYPVKGEITSISGSTNPQTGSIKFRATFDNPDLLLKDGISGTIRIPQLYKQVKVIPRLSTFERQGNILAFQLKKDSVIERQIKTREAGKLYIVESGLEKGDTIVAKGVNKIKNGSKIKPKPTQLDSIVQSFDKVFK